MKLEHYLTKCTKVKWFKDLNIRHDTVKILEENIGKTFSDVKCGSIFLDQSSKAKEIKAKIKQIKGFCIAKEIISKRQHTE